MKPWKSFGPSVQGSSIYSLESVRTLSEHNAFRAQAFREHKRFQSTTSLKHNVPRAQRP